MRALAEHATIATLAAIDIDAVSIIAIVSAAAISRVHFLWQHQTHPYYCLLPLYCVLSGCGCSPCQCPILFIIIIYLN